MPLSANFTDSDFEYVREICHIPNTSDNTAVLIGKLDALNAAQVTATQRDIEKWKLIEYGTEKSKGGIKGTDYSTDRNRNYITNKLRERLSYDPIAGTIGPEDLAAFSLSFPNYAGYAGDEFSQ
jgi:hypothetical protein